jgi:serine/threonine-protein kinase
VDVAVKLIHDELARDATFIERFRREAGLAARLMSPHVVRMFDHGMSEDGRPFIVMELLEGESLGKRLDREALDLRACLGVVVQVCRALSLAHERGIVHRDIKPDNIFLCEDDDEPFFCKVLDFGIARHVLAGGRKLTAPGVVVGTPEFLAPEVITGRGAAGPSADLWALSVVAYFGLALELPFGDGSSREILVRTLSRPSRPLGELRADVPPELEAFFARAFDKDPAKRFDSARQLAESFAAAVAPGIASPARFVAGPRRQGEPGWPARSARTIAHAPTLTPAEAELEEPAPALETPDPPPSTTSAPVSLRSEAPIPPPSLPPLGRMTAKPPLKEMPWRRAGSIAALAALAFGSLVGTRALMRAFQASTPTPSATSRPAFPTLAPPQLPSAAAAPSASATASAPSSEPAEAGAPPPSRPKGPDYGF